jgi:hypothetical protein
MPATYEPIATTTVSSSVTSITLSSIPQTYTDLVFVSSLTTDNDNTNLILRFNGDSSSLYSQTYMAGTGSVVTTGRESNQGRILVSGATATPNSTAPATFIGSISNYTNTSINKTAVWRWNVPSATYPGVQANVGWYRSTSGITQISLIITTSNITSGSTLTLYGIKAA